jgi:hypothetical protein
LLPSKNPKQHFQQKYLNQGVKIPVFENGYFCPNIPRFNLPTLYHSNALSRANLLHVIWRTLTHQNNYIMATSVGQFSLHNGGGFVVAISFDYLDENLQMQRSQSGSNFPVGQTQTVDPGTLGVPNGSTLWLHADVVWGTDNVASQGFVYQSGNSSTANYTITGTTLSNTMGLINVSN